MTRKRPVLRKQPRAGPFFRHVVGRGEKDGRPAEVVVDVLDCYDEATGFTAMERTTGWDGSIKAILNAQGVTPRGVNPAEVAVSGPQYMAELRRRGFNLTETLEN